jgi:HEAT repeat protein
MPEQITSELQKLSGLAADMTLTEKIRHEAVQSIGNIGNHEALLVLLDLAANKNLPVKDRDLAIKFARSIIKRD